MSLPSFSLFFPRPTLSVASTPLPRSPFAPSSTTLASWISCARVLSIVSRRSVLFSLHWTRFRLYDADSFPRSLKAYRITKEKDYVPEMVFLLGRMGNSKDALMLIIERLGDVQRVSAFLSITTARLR